MSLHSVISADFEACEGKGHIERRDTLGGEGALLVGGDGGRVCRHPRRELLGSPLQGGSRVSTSAPNLKLSLQQISNESRNNDFTAVEALKVENKQLNR